jgi:hypothetical protein
LPGSAGSLSSRCYPSAKLIRLPEWFDPSSLAAAKELPGVALSRFCKEPPEVIRILVAP